MSKTIWYISKYANISLFGADTRQAGFCKSFAEVGFDVRLILSNSSHLYSGLPCFSGFYKNMEVDGYKVTWVRTPKYNNPSGVKRLIGWVWFEVLVMLLCFRKSYKKPDVVISSSLSLLSVFSGIFFKKIFKAKFILEIRDIWPKSIVSLKGVSPKHPIVSFFSYVERLGYKHADDIVGTMPGLHCHVESIICDARKVHFIPHGVSLSYYKEHSRDIGQEFINNYFPSNKFVVVYAGAMGVANGVEFIVDAARKLEEKANVHFVFVGDGYLKSKLMEMSSDLTNVTFAPKVSKEYVQSVLSHADLLIASVRDEEIYEYGISLNKFIDYMYARKPIVCMFSGYPSMLNEANCGRFVPAEDPDACALAILDYVSMSSEQRAVIGENGYRFLVESRNFDVLAKQYMELFQ